MEVKEVYAYQTTTETTLVEQSGISLLPWTYKEINVPVNFTSYKSGTVGDPQLYGGTNIKNFLTMFLTNKNIFQGDIYKQGTYTGTWNGSSYNQSLYPGKLSLGFIPKIIFILDTTLNDRIIQGILFPLLGLGINYYQTSSGGVQLSGLLKVTYDQEKIYWTMNITIYSSVYVTHRSLNIQNHTYYYVAMG